MAESYFAVSEAKVYRCGRRKDVLCRLTYFVELWDRERRLWRWFLQDIQELE